MKGKRACRNICNAYIDDLEAEMTRLEDAGLPADGGTFHSDVQDITAIKLSDGRICGFVKSSLTLCKLGAISAVTTHLVADNSARKVIIVDRLFEQLSDRCQRWVIAHEAGHIHYGHLGSAKEAVASAATDEDIEGAAIKQRDIEKEFAADYYAATVNGKRETIAAMKEFRRLLAKNKWIEPDPEEINLRIRHLMMTQVQAAGSPKSRLSA